jgi:membrane-anchored protein YejM (alkaline phosphatase superfamily)
LQIKKNIILAKCIKKKLTKREKKKKISKNIDIVFLFLFLKAIKGSCEEVKN